MRIFMMLTVAAFCGTSFAQEKGREINLASVDFKNATLEDVIAYFRECSGLNFHVDSAARAGDSRVTLRLKNVSLKTALNLVLKPRDLEWVQRDGVIVIAPRSIRTITRVYETRDLMFGLEDFAGPRIESRNPGPKWMGCYWLDLEEEPKVLFPADLLADLIQANTGAGWDASASITHVNGLLVITQSKAAHGEIQALLDRLRQYK